MVPRKCRLGRKADLTHEAVQLLSGARLVPVPWRDVSIDDNCVARTRSTRKVEPEDQADRADDHQDQPDGLEIDVVDLVVDRKPQDRTHGQQEERGANSHGVPNAPSRLSQTNLDE